MRVLLLIGALFGLFAPSLAYSDCVINAKSKTKYVVLDGHTLILRGGFGADIIVKTFAFVNTGSQVTILKDSFCSFDGSALYIDGEVVQVNEVTNIH